MNRNRRVNMKQKNFYLVGTVHRDPDGPQRLESLLEKVRPENIAIETSEERANQSSSHSLSEREQEEKCKKDLQEMSTKFNLTPEQVQTVTSIFKFYAVYGYEIRVPKQYAAQQAGVTVHYIDTAVEHKIHLEYTSLLDQISKVKYDAISAERFKKTLDRGADWWLQKLRTKSNELYQAPREGKEAFHRKVRAPKFLRKLKKIWPEAHRVFVNNLGAERDTVMAKNIRELYREDKRMVAICGMGHLYALEELLSDLHPYILPLNEYHKI